MKISIYINYSSINRLFYIRLEGKTIALIMISSAKKVYFNKKGGQTNPPLNR
ncbi:MAG: hypothetical protein RBR50_11165 [Candidatus Izemoplasmatales bacterium]|nr:hypothetical protein [Candidatus Izemoplasmatales bacterium]